jgi:hypothetical protein
MLLSFREADTKVKVEYRWHGVNADALSRFSAKNLRGVPEVTLLRGFLSCAHSPQFSNRAGSLALKQ